MNEDQSEKAKQIEDDTFCFVSVTGPLKLFPLCHVLLTSSHVVCADHLVGHGSLWVSPVIVRVFIASSFLLCLSNRHQHFTFLILVSLASN